MLYAVKPDTGANDDCMHLYNFELCYHFRFNHNAKICIVSSLKIACDLRAGECQLPSSSAPDGFPTKKLLSNPVLSFTTSLNGLASYADARLDEDLTDTQHGSEVVRPGHQG